MVLKSVSLLVVNACRNPGCREDIGVQHGGDNCSVNCHHPNTRTGPVTAASLRATVDFITEIFTNLVHNLQCVSSLFTNITA